MSNTLSNIRISRLLLALVTMFLIVDTFPHPNLGPGLIESVIQHERTVSNP